MMKNIENMATSTFWYFPHQYVWGTAASYLIQPQSITFLIINKNINHLRYLYVFEAIILIWRFQNQYPRFIFRYLIKIQYLHIKKLIFTSILDYKKISNTTVIHRLNKDLLKYFFHRLKNKIKHLIIRKSIMFVIGSQPN